MARNSVLRWLDGRGWLVLSGGQDDGSVIRARAIGRISADGGVAYITMGGDSSFGEAALADMEDLGAPSGYLVDILSEDDTTIQQKLSEAGLIVIAAGANPTELRSSLLGAAVEGMKVAFENGAVILAEDLSTAVLGYWLVLDSGKIINGLGWLENGLVVPGVTAVSESDTGKTVLKAHTDAIAVAIGAGSALALGPDGEIETWGMQQVTVALGTTYHA